LFTNILHKKYPAIKYFDDEDTFRLKKVPLQILEVATLQIVGENIQTIKFAQAIMHGEMRIPHHENDKNIVFGESFMSILKKTPFPKLTCKRYYVLNEERQLLQFKKWDTPNS